jgi:hypothetical protein
MGRGGEEDNSCGRLGNLVIINEFVSFTQASPQ